MKTSDYIPYLLISSFLYFIFFIVLAIFGSIILVIIKNRNKEDWEISKLSFVIISFAIGLAEYLCLSYILLIFNLLNFFTGYLPLVITDLIYLIFLQRRKKFRINLNEFKRKLWMNKKNIIVSSLILLFIFYLQYLEFWPILTRNSSLLASDTYEWTSKVWLITEYNHIDFKLFNAAYPDGFSIICAGNLMIIPNKTVSYFFMKLGGTFFLMTFILVMYSISRDFFKRKFYLIFASLVLVVIYRYFMYRTIIFLPSVMASLLIFICLILFLSKLPKSILGILLPAIYLIHALSALFFILCLGIFYIVRLVKSFGKRKQIFKEIILIGFISIVSLIPYIVHSYVVFNTDLIKLISYYISELTPQITSNSFQTDLNLFIQIPWIKNLGEILEFERLYELFYKYTIGPFLLLSIGGLFIFSRKRSRKSKDFILFLKISLLIVLVLFYIGYLMFDSFLRTFFYEWLILRPVETFAPYIILLTVCSIQQIIIATDRLWKSTIKKYRGLNHSKRSKIISIDLKSFLITTLIISSIIYYVRREEIHPNHYYLTLPELILFINNNIPKDSNLALNDLDHDDVKFSENRLYKMLYNYNLFYYNSTNELTFEEFRNFCINNSIDYVLIKKKYLSISRFLLDFSNSLNFTKIYQVINSDLHYGIYNFIT